MRMSGMTVEPDRSAGLWTLQLGFAATGTLYGVVLQAGAGIAWDTRGNFGFYSYYGAGAGVGVEAGVGGSVQVSNAPQIQNLSGVFTMRAYSWVLDMEVPWTYLTVTALLGLYREEE